MPVFGIVLLLVVVNTGQFQEVSRTMSPSVENSALPDFSTQTMDPILPDFSRSGSGYGAMDFKDNSLWSLSGMSTAQNEGIEPTGTDLALYSKETTTHEVTASDLAHNIQTSSITPSVVLDPIIMDQTSKMTQGNTTETDTPLSSSLQSVSPLDSTQYSSVIPVSTSLESDLAVEHSHSILNTNFNAESISAEEAHPKNQTHQFSRFSHHSISTLSLDLLSFVSAILSAQPLVTTAQTITSHPDISMTTSDAGFLSSAALSDDVAFAPNMTSVAEDISADESHNTSSVHLSTVIPRLLSAATQVDSSIPSGGGLENDTLTSAPPSEKSTHLTEGSIAGIVLGCLAAVLAFSLLMLCFCYKQKKMGALSPKKTKKKKTSHYTGLFDDGITLSYINCQFEPTKDPIDEMASLDNDAYLNSLEQYVVNQTWLTKAPSTPITNL